MEKKLIKIFVFLLLINFANVSQGYAVEYGNKNAQEIGDVVFRDLSGPFEIHGGIYKNHLNKNMPPELSHSHKVIQMTGITEWKKCLPNIFGCVKTWVGIENLDLNKFKTIEPPYYGAFEHIPNLELKTRKLIIENAETLMARNLTPKRIKYIVIEDEPRWDLIDHYFEYEDLNGDGIIEPDDIVRMRSDAFVEYCYAAAKVPIIKINGFSTDITKVNGADALMWESLMGRLYPSNQRDDMSPSVITNPEIDVVETDTNKPLFGGDTTKETDITVKASDSNSGIGRIEIRKVSLLSEYAS